MHTTDTHPDSTAVSTSPGPRLPALVRVILGPVVFFIALFASQLFVSNAMSLPLRILTHGLTLTLVVLGVWALMRWGDRRPLREAGWRWTRRSLLFLLLGIAIAVTVVVAAAITLDQTGLLRPQPVPGDAGTPLWLLVCFGLSQAFLLQGIGEELVFRGHMMQVLRSRPVLALMVSTGFFTVIHLVSSGGQQNLAERFWYLMIPLGFGFAAGSLALLTRSLWSAVGIHGGFHTGGMICLLLGIGNGPVLWVAWGVALLLVGAIALVLWRHCGSPGLPLRQ